MLPLVAMMLVMALHGHDAIPPAAKKCVAASVGATVAPEEAAWTVICVFLDEPRPFNLDWPGWTQVH